MISISGIDCCGKSTQIELLCEELKSKGRKCEVVWSREIKRDFWKNSNL